MTLSDLISRVREYVPDSGFSDSQITNILNEGVLFVASQYDLPDLIANDTVTTTSNPYVALPSNYHKHVFRVFIDDRTELKSLYDKNSLYLLVRQYPNLKDVGRPQHWAVVGSRLYYQPKPDSATDIDVWYYRLPVDMASDTDEPDGIHAAYHGLIVHWASWKLFSRIEDGLKTNKPNALYHHGEFMAMLHDFIVFAGLDAEPYEMADESDEFIA